jgi:hypothetical protein
MAADDNVELFNLFGHLEIFFVAGVAESDQDGHIFGLKKKGVIL